MQNVYIGCYNIDLAFIRSAVGSTNVIITFLYQNLLYLNLIFKLTCSRVFLLLLFTGKLLAICQMYRILVSTDQSNGAKLGVRLSKDLFNIKIAHEFCTFKYFKFSNSGHFEI